MTMKTALAFFALSASMAAAQTFPDDLVERVVEALESLQSIVLEHSGDSGAGSNRN